MEMVKMTIYKKDVYIKNNKIISFKTYATYLTGNKKGTKVPVRLMIPLKFEDLIGKIFFATIVKINNTNYITNCIIQ